MLFVFWLFNIFVLFRNSNKRCSKHVSWICRPPWLRWSGFFYLKITLNIHASLEILKKLPPWLCCVKTFILLKELGLEPCWQPPPSQRGLPGQLSTAQQRPKISGFIFFKTQRMVQLSNYQKCNLLCRFPPWCIWLCDSGWGEDTSHSGLWW